MHSAVNNMHSEKGNEIRGDEYNVHGGDKIVCIMFTEGFKKLN